MNITRETFLDLLAAVENICPEAEPADQHGTNMTDTALDAANTLFDLIERKGKGHRAGVLTVVKLLAEVASAKDQEKYAQQQAKRGWDGERMGSEPLPAHEFTVDFLRYMSDDQEIADKAFQGGTPQERLTKQLCEELDANPALVGTYTVEALSIQGDEERFQVQFNYQHPGKKGHALQPFRAELQATYDRYGMAGSFNIRR
jgi:hypothetical protein